MRHEFIVTIYRALVSIAIFGVTYLICSLDSVNLFLPMKRHWRVPRV